MNHYEKRTAEMGAFCANHQERPVRAMACRAEKESVMGTTSGRDSGEGLIAVGRIMCDEAATVHVRAAESGVWLAEKDQAMKSSVSVHEAFEQRLSEAHRLICRHMRTGLPAKPELRVRISPAVFAAWKRRVAVGSERLFELHS
jgi:hypothetical protein